MVGGGGTKGPKGPFPTTPRLSIANSPIVLRVEIGPVAEIDYGKKEVNEN